VTLFKSGMKFKRIERKLEIHAPWVYFFKEVISDNILNHYFQASFEELFPQIRMKIYFEKIIQCFLKKTLLNYGHIISVALFIPQLNPYLALHKFFQDKISLIFDFLPFEYCMNNIFLNA
jgi:hypothetical protein